MNDLKPGIITTTMDLLMGANDDGIMIWDHVSIRIDNGQEVWGVNDNAVRVHSPCFIVACSEADPAGVALIIGSNFVGWT